MNRDNFVKDPETTRNAILNRDGAPTTDNIYSAPTSVKHFFISLLRGGGRRQVGGGYWTWTFRNFGKTTRHRRRQSTSANQCAYPATVCFPRVRPPAPCAPSCGSQPNRDNHLLRHHRTAERTSVLSRSPSSGPGPSRERMPRLPGAARA